MVHVVVIIFLFALAACVGSFLNVVIYRLPRGESIVFPGSHCPNCGRAIKWYDNVPLASWLLLRGKCRFCKEPISPRYLMIEVLTAALVVGLYVCFYVLELRDIPDHLIRDLGYSPADYRRYLPAHTWPTFAAYAILLGGLLVCSAVDIESWIVPLEVCWFVSAAGVAIATIKPPLAPFMPPVHPMLGAMSVAALLGLILAIILQKRGLIQPSFVDAADVPAPAAGQPRTAAAVTKSAGVNPRKEILREVLFLGPAIVFATVAWFIVAHVPAAKAWWSGLSDSGISGAAFAPRFSAFEAAIFGYLLGGAMVWGIRIFGTLAFGKEAMGLGDVHILAMVGAVCGWKVPLIAFFVAPVFGLAWAARLWLGRRQRELPYGPWLAMATFVVIIFYDWFMQLLEPYGRIFSGAR
ncbi:MAG: prepilin peptidase [Planctomycetaceae bacterium]|nr:prepilin peptidase [Planctomycetaceae bacterium]